MKQRVSELIADYHSVEQSGHHSLNKVRTIAGSLGGTWGRFEKELEERLSRLESSMKLQEALFEVCVLTFVCVANTVQ